MVVADPGGKRVGSGGSTIFCLLEVLNRELSATRGPAIDWEAVENVFRSRRILIVHAGGDSRRLPAYGPCGKIFVPVPGPGRWKLPPTMFDRLLETFAPLPPAHRPAGGEWWWLPATPWCVSTLRQCGWPRMACDGAGLFRLAQEAARHGVFCPRAAGRSAAFCRSRRPPNNAKRGPSSQAGLSILDVAVMSSGPTPPCRCCGPSSRWLAPTGRSPVRPTWKRSSFRGLDLYREICCGATGE